MPVCNTSLLGLICGALPCIIDKQLMCQRLVREMPIKHHLQHRPYIQELYCQNQVLRMCFCRQNSFEFTFKTKSFLSVIFFKINFSLSFYKQSLQDKFYVVYCFKTEVIKQNLDNEKFIMYNDVRYIYLYLYHPSQTSFPEIFR